jgi:pimeloyl-ACP methyl ester carboxylesterase
MQLSTTVEVIRLAGQGGRVSFFAVPTYLWQGSDDPMVSFAYGQRLAARIPGVTAHLEQSEQPRSVPSPDA